MRAEAKFKVKKAICEESSATSFSVFDCEFGFDTHAWFRSYTCKHIYLPDMLNTEADLYRILHTQREREWTELMARECVLDRPFLVLKRMGCKTPE